MTARRPADFVLAQAVRAAGFTPRADDVEPLLDLLLTDDEEAAKHAERALLKLGAVAGRAALARVPAAAAQLRPRLPRLVGRLAADDATLRAPLLALLRDPDPRTRRAAVSALGKLAGDDVETALLAEWDVETRGAERRALATALGKAGGRQALATLRAARLGDDAELRRIVDQAVLMIERTVRRDVTAGAIDGTRAAARPLPTVVRCRAGLERLLAGELTRYGAKVRAPGVVDATLTGPLAGIFAARTMLRFGFPLPAVRGEVVAAVTRAMTGEAARDIFTAFTSGPVRWRLDWAGGGHRRAQVWKIAHAVAEARPDLLNDPTDSAWEAVVHERADGVVVELSPKALPDPRFAYRTGDVPAASHPTLAAALARVAGARANDVVWDPFVGSGTELIERARLGPYASLEGSDLEEAALVVASDNLAAAGVEHARLVRAGATTHAPRGVTLIITNPPMGRRVHRGDVGPLLDRFVDHAAEVLVRGGRMVWLSPLPARTAARAVAAGLRVGATQDVDMGGFGAQIQELIK